ncbi:MAG: sigma-54 dependent transcriptional regulator [candidate division KSB1 bacterium]|nr:sigma-54 dependent transcriptional regulator [candidate division KSB1 bacterium]
MSSYTILVVDDELQQAEVLAGFLRKRGFQVLVSGSAREALEKLRAHAIDLVLTDMRMPEMEGLELLRKGKEINPEVDFIVLTAFGSVENAVEAMKQGAIDYLTKPIDLDQLELVVGRAHERKQLLSENRWLREQLATRHDFANIVSVSQRMHEALSIAARAAPTRATVLILGESGTGKELIARAIHAASPRKDKPFVVVNCAALPESLLESELFGHEKGAFTGADRLRKGRFELADGGTLFIDEVGDLPPQVQVKLLRVLQEGTFERVGGSETLKVDVRIVAATNRDLDRMVEEKSFREDLYYRLNVVRIWLPPLRERKEDIPHLLDHFLHRFAQEYGKHLDGFSREALDLLLKYDYPGNVRELQNIVEQAVVLARSNLITTAELPPTLRSRLAPVPESDENATLPEKVAAFEKRLILEALEKAQGVQTRAAELLGITERNLRYKLQKYGLR